MGYNPIFAKNLAPTQEELNFYACYPKTQFETFLTKVGYNPFSYKTKNARKTWATTQCFWKNLAPTRVKLNFHAWHPKQGTTWLKLSFKFWWSKWATTIITKALILFWTGSGIPLYWTEGRPPRLTLPFGVWQQWNLVGIESAGQELFKTTTKN